MRSPNIRTLLAAALLALSPALLAAQRPTLSTATKAYVTIDTAVVAITNVLLIDGTGAAADGTNDLLVTSDAAAKVGDVITATGTVAVDKDFTAGYAYAVLVEGAILK